MGKYNNVTGSIKNYDKIGPVFKNKQNAMLKKIKMIDAIIFNFT